MTELLLQAIGSVFVWSIIISVYLIPTMIASERKHTNLGSVFLLNLLLGWTMIGWISAFVWSFVDSCGDEK